MPPPYDRHLLLPVYEVRQAARLTGVSPQRVSAWNRGYGDRSAASPLIRTNRPKRQRLNYLQLVEVAVAVRFIEHGVRHREIRKAGEYLQQVFEREYPFAEERLLSDGSDILKEWREVEAPAGDRLIITSGAGQMRWPSLVQERLQEFDYRQGLALTWHPRGKDIPVAVDPTIAYGAPTLETAGIPTWVLADRYRSDETIAEIEEDFGLSREDVLTALKFEGVALNGAAA